MNAAIYQEVADILLSSTEARADQVSYGKPQNRAGPAIHWVVAHYLYMRMNGAMYREAADVFLINAKGRVVGLLHQALYEMLRYGSIPSINQKVLYIL